MNSHLQNACSGRTRARQQPHKLVDVFELVDSPREVDDALRAGTLESAPCSAFQELLRELAVEGRLKREYCYEVHRRIMGGSDVDAFNRLMTDLENDFYVRFDPKGYFEFACKILRDWWLRYYGMEVDA